MLKAKWKGVIIIAVMSLVEIFLMDFVVDDWLESIAGVGIYFIAIGMVIIYEKFGVDHKQEG